MLGRDDVEQEVALAAARRAAKGRTDSGVWARLEGRRSAFQDRGAVRVRRGAAAEFVGLEAVEATAVSTDIEAVIDRNRLFARFRGYLAEQVEPGSTLDGVLNELAIRFQDPEQPWKYRVFQRVRRAVLKDAEMLELKYSMNACA